MGLSRLWINLTVEAAIKEVYAFSSFLLFRFQSLSKPPLFLCPINVHCIDLSQNFFRNFSELHPCKRAWLSNGITFLPERNFG